MAGIYHPSRGGVRGGRDQFDWDDVKTDKDRECYLGHSVMVPTGKWQEGKDLIWYTRDKKNKDEIAVKKKKELNAVKDLEARAMAAALGHKSFSVGSGTSLTAKELQEVLSRGKTEHADGERIQGVGHKKKLSNSKAEKSGMSFEGFNTNQDGGSESEDERPESSKKKKKKKEKKKKKKKARNSSDSENDVVTEESRRRRRNNEMTRNSKSNETKNSRRYEDDICERRQPRHDADRYRSNDKHCEQDRHFDQKHSKGRRSRSRSPPRRRSRSLSPQKRRNRSQSPQKRRNRSRSPQKHRSRSRSPQKLRNRSQSPQKRRSRSRSPQKHRSRSRSSQKRRSRSPHRKSSPLKREGQRTENSGAKRHRRRHDSSSSNDSR